MRIRQPDARTKRLHSALRARDKHCRGTPPEDRPKRLHHGHVLEEDATRNLPTPGETAGSVRSLTGSYVSFQWPLQAAPKVCRGSVCIVQCRKARGLKAVEP